MNIADSVDATVVGDRRGLFFVTRKQRCPTRPLLRLWGFRLIANLHDPFNHHFSTFCTRTTGTAHTPSHASKKPRRRTERSKYRRPSYIKYARGNGAFS